MRIFLLFYLTLQTSLFAQLAPKLITSLPSSHFITGEVGHLYFIFENRDLNSPPPERIIASGMNIQRTGFTIQVANHRRYYIYNYRFVAMHPGSYTIPAVTFDFAGTNTVSEPQHIQVIPRADLTPSTIEVAGETITCYSKLFSEKSTLYPGQTSQLEYKIYLPETIRIMQWGLPLPQTVENATAWRFSAPENEGDIGSAVINGQNHQVAGYHTVLTAGNPGTAKFGPLENRVVCAVGYIDPVRGQGLRRVDLTVTAPLTQFTITPFPVAPPAGFQGAVGDFTLEAILPATTKMSDTDTLKATVKVSGRGNLPDLVAPTLVDKDHWKLIDSSRIQQGDERKNQQGTAGFTYILSPKASAVTMPSFEFIYFDPEKEKFITYTTPTSPLQVTAAPSTADTTNTPPTTDAPAENMSDIIAELPSDLLIFQPPIWKQWPIWLWQIIPVSLLLLMLGLKCRSHIRHRRISRASDRLKMQHLKKVASHDEPILKAAGAYIQKWLHAEKHPELEQILHERDQLCYQPDPNTPEPDSKRRREIVKILKKFSLLILCFVLTSLGSARAGDDSLPYIYASDDYPRAIKDLNSQLRLHKPTSPNYSAIQFYLGRAYYRTNQPGFAAYHYQIAADARDSFPEATKNLEFIQRQQGSILADKEPSDLDRWIATFSPSIYRQISYGCGWLLILSFIYLRVFHPRGWKFGTALSISIIAPLILFTTLYAESQHPHRVIGDQYTPAMVLVKTPLLTEPIDPMPGDSEKSILLETPAASPCQLIATRGDYAYIQLENGLRGWLKAESVKALP